MLEKFPPKHPSQLSGDGSQAWCFLLPDGLLIGGEELVNHYEMLGLTKEETYNLDSLKRKFCVENHVVRVCFSNRHLYVEIFDLQPNEAQWGSIGTLYRRDDETTVVWDIWVSTKGKWTHGEGSLPEFKRCFSANFRRKSIKRKAARNPVDCP